MVKTKFLPIAFGVMFIMMVFGFFLYNKFLVLISEKKPEVWIKLGSPKLFFNNSINSNLRVFIFLKNKQYLQLNNPQLTKISNFLWNYIIIYLLIFVLVLFLFVIALK